MKLSKLKLGILSLCGVLALAGVGASLAYVITPKSDSGNVSTDPMIYVDWTEQSATINNVSNLNATEAQYREVGVKYGKSDNVTQSPQVSFVLTTQTAGLKVSILEGIKWSDYNKLTAQEQQKHTITDLTSASGTKVYTLNATSVEATQNYSLRFSYSAKADEVIEGSLKITLGFSA